MDGVEATDVMTVGGVPGLLESGPDGGGGDDLGDEYGLLLLEPKSHKVERGSLEHIIDP